MNVTLIMLSGVAIHCTKCIEEKIAWPNYAYVQIQERPGVFLCDHHNPNPRPSTWGADGKRVLSYAGVL